MLDTPTYDNRQPWERPGIVPNHVRLERIDNRLKYVENKIDNVLEIMKAYANSSATFEEVAVEEPKSVNGKEVKGVISNLKKLKDTFGTPYKMMSEDMQVPISSIHAIMHRNPKRMNREIFNKIVGSELYSKVAA